MNAKYLSKTKRKEKNKPITRESLILTVCKENKFFYTNMKLDKINYQ